MTKKIKPEEALTQLRELIASAAFDSMGQWVTSMETTETEETGRHYSTTRTVITIVLESHYPEPW